jgi:hypothetical protein
MAVVNTPGAPYYDADGNGVWQRAYRLRRVPA